MLSFLHVKHNISEWEKELLLRKGVKEDERGLFNI